VVDRGVSSENQKDRTALTIADVLRYAALLLPAVPCRCPNDSKIRVDPAISVMSLFDNADSNTLPAIKYG